MCDFLAGEILVSHHKGDVAAQNVIEAIRGREDHRFEHFHYLESVEEKLRRADISAREELVSNFVRLAVPIGKELFKANILQHIYRLEMVQALANGKYPPDSKFLLDSRHSFQVVPNSLLTPCFAFDQPRHGSYKKLFGCCGPSTSRRTILIIDSGVPTPNAFNIARATNFVDPKNSSNVTDDHPREHGTAVAEIIADICPKAQLIIYKVVDSNNHASEWDTLAALAARTGADVINLSLAFGLNDVRCSHCGRESRSSRSAVFENMIDQVIDSGSVIVAAAGNKGINELAFPSRFNRVLAIESINEQLDLSDFSNHSDKDEDGNTHQRVFVLPGGDINKAAGKATEWVGTAAKGKLWGTSFAAAYASAIVADAWDQPSNSSKSPDQIVDWLVKKADTSLPKYSASDYGNGLMKM